MDIVDGLYAGYQERPEQPLIDEEGNEYPRAPRVPPISTNVKKAAIVP